MPNTRPLNLGHFPGRRVPETAIVVPNIKLFHKVTLFLVLFKVLLPQRQGDFMGKFKY
jgi:hypothetical protein